MRHFDDQVVIITCAAKNVDLVRSVAFLASDEARDINGQAIELDSGRVMS